MLSARCSAVEALSRHVQSSLKKEIISASGLGDGSDFNLHISPQDDHTSEPKDDTTLIPRSSTIM